MVKFGWQFRHDYVRKAVGVLGLMACVGLVACGSGDETASTDVPSLGGTATTARTTSTTVNPEKAAQNFVKCLRDEGLEVADPEMGSDGNIDMRSIFESANIQPGSDEFRTAMDACREFLDNAGFGPSDEDRAQRQEAMLAFTACLRGEGLDVEDIEFAGPGGARPGPPPGATTSGASGAIAGATAGSSGASGALGRATGAVGTVGEAGGPQGGPQGGPGPMSEADRQTRLAEMLGLDPADPKVTSALETCSDELAALGGPGQRPGASGGSNGVTPTTKG